MLRKFIAVISLSCALLVSGCLEESKVAAGVLEALYCSDMTKDNREKVLKRLRDTIPSYPEHGFCGIRSGV